MKVKLNRNYKYYLPFIFAMLLFIIVLYYFHLVGAKQLIQKPEQVLSTISNGEKLITDKQVAKVAVNSPLILGDEIGGMKSLNNSDHLLKTVEITDVSAELVEIIDPNTIITFKNSTTSNVHLVGAENIWQANLKPQESYSQMFEKPGQYKFTINDQPIGVVRVRSNADVIRR